MSENQDRPQVEPEQAEPGVGGAAAAPEKLLRTREVLLELLAKLGVEADVEVRDAAEAITCNVQVKSGGGIFEQSPRGQVLDSLQYLLGKLVSREGEDRKRITVDLGAFRDLAPDPAMDAMARRLGAASRRIGKPLTIVPMASRDRRAVHVALAEVKGVGTRSVGEGVLRRLIVEPRDDAAPPAPPPGDEG